MLPPRDVDVPEVPLGNELTLHVPSLPGEFADPLVDLRQRVGFHSRYVSQGAAERVLKASLPSLALDRFRQGQQLADRVLIVRHGFSTGGAGYGELPGTLPERHRPLGLACFREMVGHNLRRVFAVAHQQLGRDPAVNERASAAKERAVGGIPHERVLE